MESTRRIGKHQPEVRNMGSGFGAAAAAIKCRCWRYNPESRNSKRALHLSLLCHHLWCERPPPVSTLWKRRFPRGLQISPTPMHTS